MQYKKLNYLKGLSAEAFASTILKLKGFQILFTRYKSPFGEIDIIAKKQNLIIACEIKYRKNLDTALYSISQSQQIRIIHAFQYWLQNNHYLAEMYDTRLDAFLIYKYGFRHYENAWQAD